MLGREGLFEQERHREPVPRIPQNERKSGVRAAGLYANNGSEQSKSEKAAAKAVEETRPAKSKNRLFRLNR
jgi:hypothetical protein